MNELTNEQIAEVAREVTGDPAFYDGYAILLIAGWSEDDYPIAGQQWYPSLTGDDWQRLQALAVVEYVCDRIKFLSDPALFANVVLAIINKDITALQRMVLELKK